MGRARPAALRLRPRAAHLAVPVCAGAEDAASGGLGSAPSFVCTSNLLSRPAALSPVAGGGVGRAGGRVPGRARRAGQRRCLLPGPLPPARSASSLQRLRPATWRTPPVATQPRQGEARGLVLRAPALQQQIGASFRADAGLPATPVAPTSPGTRRSDQRLATLASLTVRPESPNGSPPGASPLTCI